MVSENQYWKLNIPPIHTDDMWRECGHYSRASGLIFNSCVRFVFILCCFLVLFSSCLLVLSLVLFVSFLSNKIDDRFDNIPVFNLKQRQNNIPSEYVRVLQNSISRQLTRKQQNQNRRLFVLCAFIVCLYIYVPNVPIIQDDDPFISSFSLRGGWLFGLTCAQLLQSCVVSSEYSSFNVIIQSQNELSFVPVSKH